MTKEKAKRRSFEFNSALLFVLMMMANVCNYLFQIVIARLLGDAEKYGIVTTLISFQAICNIPTTLMVMVTAKYVAQYDADEYEEKLSSVLSVLKKYAGIIGILMVVLGGVLTPFVAQNFQLEKNEYVFLIILASALLVFSSVYVGCLQGVQDFLKYGMQNLINVLTKLLISVALVLIGWEIMGVLGALVLGAILVYLYSYVYTKKYFQHKKNVQVTQETASEIKKYILGIFCFQTCINLLSNGDMLLVKYFFDGTEAGVYSSAMVIGKIALYVSGAVVGTLFPMAALEHSKGNDTRYLLKKALFYGGGVALACAIGMLIVGRWMVTLLFGEVFTNAVDYLPAISLYVVPLTFLTIITNFLAALGETRLVSYSLAIGCIASVIVAICFHNSIIQMMCWVGAILLLVFIYDIYIYTRKKKQEEKK